MEWNLVAAAKEHGQRSGQYLFNILPSWARSVVAGTLFDPFHKELSPWEVEDWIDNHLIFDDWHIVIAVFNGNDILAERPDMGVLAKVG